MAESTRQMAAWAPRLLFFLALLGSVRPILACLSDGRYVMGTILEITLCANDTNQGREVLETLFTAASRLDAQFTTFSADSPVSRLNAYAGRGAEAVPPEVVDILSLSLSYWRLTGGTFDITVGPLMVLWRQAATTHTLPSPAAVQQARACVGSEKVRLSTDGSVALTHPDMTLDLGGIGKGYALDRLAGLLRQRGIARALLNFGQSSIQALGTPPDAEGWRLLLQRSDGRAVGVITLHNQALSVSSSLGQIFEVNSHRYGHVIDPHTGEPLQRDLLACVIAPNAAQAEALSKALLILGEHDGIALMQHFPGVEGLLIEADGHQWMTPGWARAVAFTSG